MRRVSEVFSLCLFRPSLLWALSSPLPFRKPACLWGCWEKTSVRVPPPARVRLPSVFDWTRKKEYEGLFLLMSEDECDWFLCVSGKTAAFMLPVLERLIYKPRETQVTRVLVLVPTRELGIQVHSVARQLAQFTSISTCLAVGKSTVITPLIIHYSTFIFTII